MVHIVNENKCQNFLCNYSHLSQDENIGYYKCKSVCPPIPFHTITHVGHFNRLTRPESTPKGKKISGGIMFQKEGAQSFKKNKN